MYETIIASVDTWPGPYLYHATNTAEKLKSIVKSATLQTSPEFHHKAKSSRIQRNTSIDLSGGLAELINSTANDASKKGPYIVEIDKAEFKKTLEELKAQGKIPFDDTKYLNVYESFVIYHMTPNKRQIVFMPTDSTNLRNLRIEKSGHKKTITLAPNKWATLYQELSKFNSAPTQGEKPKPGQVTFDKPVESKSLSRNSQLLIFNHNNVYEGQESVILDNRPHPDHRVLRTTESGDPVYVWAIPIKINKIIIRKDRWDELPRKFQETLENLGYPLELNDYQRVTMSQNITASVIKFIPKNQYGMNFYYSKYSDKLSLIQDNDMKFRIRLYENNAWHYPVWDELPEGGFRTVEDAEAWLLRRDWENATTQSIQFDPTSVATHFEEFNELMGVIGFTQTHKPTVYEYNSPQIKMVAMYDPLQIRIKYYVNGKQLNPRKVPTTSSSISKTFYNIEKVLNRYKIDILSCIEVTCSKSRNAILAASNARDLTKDLVRVKSSNIWSYGINVKKRGDKVGDVLVQFKGKEGGPGAVYIYYDVPIRVYRRWVTSPSKGHYFWQYIRNTYYYSKLTGDKRGKLKNAIN